MNWSGLSPDAQGLVPAIVQDGEGLVRMLGYMNDAAFSATLETGLVTFWSRSRRELWTKGATSGNTLHVVSMQADCDNDALLVTARPAGPTCHTGSESCFGAVSVPPTSSKEGSHPRIEAAVEEGEPQFGFLETLWDVIASRAKERPEGSYTTTLLESGPDLPARKLVEEATEVLIAAKNHAAGIDDDQRLAEEAADVVYHLLVTLAERGIDPSLVTGELRRRHAT